MFDLARFDSYREDNRREVKAASGGLPRALWETYSAFANCDGGVIILGVAEKEDGSWQTTGLHEPLKLIKEFWDMVNNPNKVSANLLMDEDVEVDEINGDTVIVIRVPAASRTQKPVYINGDLFRGAFRRNGEGDYRCTPEEVRAMVRDQAEQTMDTRVLEEWSIDDLNRETVQAYRNMHRSWKPSHVWGMLEDAEYLRNIGAAAVSKMDGRLHPTAAGLLMFGNEYDIVRVFPEYFLDYRETLDPSIRWTDRLQSSSGDWSGNIFDFFFRVYNKLVKDIKVPFALDGAVRIDDTPVHKAIREALANCLVNYDVYVPRGVVVKKTNEALVMENPGTIRVGKQQMCLGGESDPRSKTLMKMFNLINIGERAGSGVPDVFKTWRDQGWDEPLVEERYGTAARTFVTLPLRKSQKKQVDETSGQSKRTKQADSASGRSDSIYRSEKTERNKSRIIQFLETVDSASSGELADMLGLSRDRARVIANEMVEAGSLQMSGATNTRRYFLKKEK